MQALRNFHRGLWLSAWYSTLLVTGAIIADACFEPGETIYLGITYTRPTFFSYWTPLWHILLVGIIAIICFWLLFESFEEDYIEYLFVDYAIGIETPSHELHFSEDEVIQFAGSVSNEITADSDIINKNIGEPEEESPTPENKED
jgi:hypothetical protein